jgi:hypothetical protein
LTQIFLPRLALSEPLRAETNFAPDGGTPLFGTKIDAALGERFRDLSLNLAMMFTFVNPSVQCQLISVLSALL